MTAGGVMDEEDSYLPYNRYLEQENSKNWVSVKLNLSHLNIAQEHVVYWCNSNIKGKWSMRSIDTYLFNDGADAVVFKFKFGLK